MAKKPTEPKPDLLAAWIDELGDIQKKLAPHRALILREKDLKEFIRARYDDKDAEKEFSPEGSRFVALLGAKGIERRIVDMPRVFTALRKASFLKACSMTMKALEGAAIAAGCPELVEAVLLQDRTGHRSLKVVEKGTPA